MDGPAAQLHNETQESVQRSLHLRRPLLHHLNADTSWLLQLPRPSRSASRNTRHWFNILIDPWLSGSQSDVASWFSQQWHVHEPAIGSIARLEELAKDIEDLTGGLDSIHEHDILRSEGSLIDAIVISHEFTDHCHKETLLECHPDIPVFATTQAAKLIQSWKHFRLVLDTPAFAGREADWKALSLPPLPDWVAIGKLVNEKDALYYHSAILIAFDCNESPRRKWSARYSNGDMGHCHEPESTAEAVIYTPHGIEAPALEVLSLAKPRIETLALLHGLHDVAISMQQLNMGAHNGLKAQRMLKPRYWLGTHDEVKRGAGLVNWFLKRKVISLADALRLEEKHGHLDHAENGTVKKIRPLEDVHFLDLGNGESIVLT